MRSSGKVRTAVWMGHHFCYNPSQKYSRRIMCLSLLDHPKLGPSWHKTTPYTNLSEHGRHISSPANRVGGFKVFRSITIPSTPPSHINEPSEPSEHALFWLLASTLRSSPRNTRRVVCPFPTIGAGFATMAPHRVCHSGAPKEELTA